MQGYIKDYRKEIESDIWMMPPLYHRVWQYLKYMVNHEEAEIPMKDGTKFKINIGQHLTSLRGISKAIGWYEGRVKKEPNPKTIKTILDWLEKVRMISQNRSENDERGNRQYTLITIINWDIYQSKEERGNSKVTVKKQCADINKNVKNDKNVKKVKEYNQNTVDLTEHLIYWIKTNNENAKIPASLDRWNDEMDKIERIDKYDYIQIRSVIDWCQQDPFWKSNILSASKLREKMGTLIMQMQRPKTDKISSFTRIQQLAREEEEKEREASGRY